MAVGGLIGDLVRFQPGGFSTKTRAKARCGRPLRSKRSSVGATMSTDSQRRPSFAGSILLLALGVIFLLSVGAVIARLLT